MIIAFLLLCVTLLSNAQEDGTSEGRTTVTILTEQTFDNSFRQSWTFRRRNTSPAYAKGRTSPWVLGDTSNSDPTNGSLQIQLGGTDDTLQMGMIAGWRRKFRVTMAQIVTATKSDITTNTIRGTMQFDYFIQQTSGYDSQNDESAIFWQLDGDNAGGGGGQDVVITETIIFGGGMTMQGTVTVDIGHLSQGPHQIFLGVYNTRKSAANAYTTVKFDNIVILGHGDNDENGEGGLNNEENEQEEEEEEEIILQAPPLSLTHPISPQQAVDELISLSQFRKDIASLASFGDRRDRTARNKRAAVWLEQELQQMGYDVGRARVTKRRGTRSRYSVYATKRVSDQNNAGGGGRSNRYLEAGMYILSCHFDGLGNGGAVNDDAAGCALVLALARALSHAEHVNISVRMIFWNAEEFGMLGSSKYLSDRWYTQGLLDSDEPRWLGMIQFDQILFDHGPNGANRQAADADIDIEYQEQSELSASSQQLAVRFQLGASIYATEYPDATVSSNMRNTDSVSFENDCPSISIRDNTRDEIGNGSHPHWHRATDVMSSYRAEDFRFGFNVVKMAIGTVWDMVEAE